jgi:hypothetical protein
LAESASETKYSVGSACAFDGEVQETGVAANKLQVNRKIRTNAEKSCATLLRRGLTL